MKVEIFTTPTCPFCARTKEYLNARNISYIEHNVGVDEESRQRMIQLSSQFGVPVINIDEKVIVGFDKFGLDNTLKKAA